MSKRKKRRIITGPGDAPVIQDNAEHKKSDHQKLERREVKQSGRLDKYAGKAELLRAKASARKWLFFIIAAGIGAYLLISGSGGVSLSALKGLLGL